MVFTAETNHLSSLDSGPSAPLQGEPNNGGFVSTRVSVRRSHQTNHSKEVNAPGFGAIGLGNKNGVNTPLERFGRYHIRKEMSIFVLNYRKKQE